MLRVESFLGCFKLETGGLVIGWLSLVQDVISFFLCLIGIVMGCIYSCEDFKKMFDMTTDPDFDDTCKMAKSIVIAVLIILMLVSIAFAWISFSCIKGTENRNHSRVKPMMILLAITAVLCFLNILTFTPSAIISGLLYGFVYGYLFVVIYSLHETFKEEYERGVSAQYLQPGGKV